MSGNTPKIICAAALIATPLALEWKANGDLRREIARLRSSNPSAPAQHPDADPAAQAQARLAATRTARIAAENRVAELVELKKRVETEVVVSFGSIETMAKRFAKGIRLGESLEKANGDTGELDADALRERTAMAEQAAEGLTDLIGMFREIPRLERSPEKAARFYATLYGEVADLDAAGRTLVEERTRDWLRGLQNEGLALPQRPKGKAKEWDDRRNAALNQLVQTLSSQLPPPKPGTMPITKLFGFSDDAGTGPSSYEVMTGGDQP